MLLTTLTSSQWPQARAPSSGPWTAQPKRQDSACNHLNATGHCHFDTICCVSVVDGWISMRSWTALAIKQCKYITIRFGDVCMRVRVCVCACVCVCVRVCVSCQDSFAQPLIDKKNLFPLSISVHHCFVAFIYGTVRGRLPPL